MTKGTTGRRIIGSRQRRASPYPLPSINESMDSHVKDSHESVKKDWEDATCSVCMEYPHNAVLLLCSSYDKGCRPYMCGTSFRYSNCLDQYKKYTKVTLPHHSRPHHDTTEGLTIDPLSSRDMDKSEAAKLQCPLCRGQVKGWTVLEHARKYLNTKKRNCMQENCSFVGTYKELRKHVKVDHPSARPQKVDPILKQKWSRLEHDRDRDDVISTIRSSMPGAVVLGDYVIEANNNRLDSDDMGNDRIESDFMNMFMFLHPFDSARNERDTNRALNGSRVGLNRGAAIRSVSYSDQDGDTDGDFRGSGGVSLVNRLRRHGRVLLGRSGRRQRHRDAMFY